MFKKLSTYIIFFHALLFICSIHAELTTDKYDETYSTIEENSIFTKPIPDDTTTIFDSFTKPDVVEHETTILANDLTTQSETKPIETTIDITTKLEYEQTTRLQEDTTGLPIAETTSETFVTEASTTSVESTTVPIKTTTKPIILDSTHIKFNTSTVIVWEKCGIEVRTQVTKIFESINLHNVTTLLYDPSINILILQITSNSQVIKKQIIKLPSITSEVVFFLFNEPGKINIYLDCPSISKTKLEVFFAELTLITHVELFKNSQGFASLEAAMQTFRCKAAISVIPGTIIHFDGDLTASISTLLISFIYDKESFSISFQNNIFVVTTSHQTISITLNKPITSTGIYLIFTNNGLQFFVNCPQFNELPHGIWNTTIFQTKISIETSRIFNIGSASTAVLLYAFCSTNNVLHQIQVNQTVCVSTSVVQSNLQAVDHANKVYSKFLPSKGLMSQIETFDSFNALNFGQLVENEPKILFASRHNAQPEFFYKSITEYAEGFTDGQNNFWIGLDTLHKATMAHNYKLRIVATSKSQIDFVEEYLNFKVANKSENYKLSVSGLVLGTNGFFSKINGVEFSTYDFGDKLLAQDNGAGFWLTRDNYFCFSCVSNNYNTGSSVKVWLSEAKNVEVFSIKMYLVPNERTYSNPLVESAIMKNTSAHLSSELLNMVQDVFYDKIELQLLYRGSRDGFTAQAFHSKSNGYPDTLIIIRSTNGNIFGGFTKVDWGSSNGYKQDKDAFLFSMVNQYSKPVIMKSRDGYSIHVYQNYMPVFGGHSSNYHSLLIAENCNLNANSYSRIANEASYSIPFAVNDPNSFLAGSANFQVSEIEVFRKI